jgi:hypothetical protein
MLVGIGIPAYVSNYRIVSCEIKNPIRLYQMEIRRFETVNKGGAEMLVCGQLKTCIKEVIDNHIHVWSSSADFAPLARVLERDREGLAARLAISMKEEGRKRCVADDKLRLFLIQYALEQVSTGIEPSHFIIFKESETVQVILEDSFGVEQGYEEDKIVIPYKEEALKIIVRCLFRKRAHADITNDVASFMHLFSREKPVRKADQDRIMRYKSMVWLVYLAMEVVRVEKMVWGKGVEYFRKRIRELLDHAIDGNIINENSRKPGFEGGKWEDTLFGWLQGEDRRPLAIKLRRQFNLENRMEHANRCLLAEHRKCIFEQVMALWGGLQQRGLF